MTTLTPKQEKYLTLSLIDEIGPIAFKKILNYFKTIDSFWNSKTEEIFKAGLSRQQVKNWRDTHKNNLSLLIEKIKKIIQEENIQLLPYEDEHYPLILKEISSPPPLLFYQGNLNALKQISLAIVGSRDISAYGKMVLKKLVPEILSQPITIVSGLAIGADSLAHQLTLEHNGLTAAILGSGLDQKSFYPKVNTRLRKDILNNKGLLISEFPPLTPPYKQNFPRRNRLITGLTKGTLVIEAAPKSGSLISAYCALDANREVMAIPGPINYKNCQGTNKLIQQGAKLITNGDDILETIT